MRLCSAASRSISIPRTENWSPIRCNRCAIIRAINPLPVPMSNILGYRTPCGLLDAALLGNGHHAPRRTPSVPTFMAQRSCHTVNCLKRKNGLLMTTTCYAVQSNMHTQIDSKADKQHCRNIAHPFLYRMEFARERVDRYGAI